MQHRLSPTRVAVAIAGAALIGTLAAPAAYARDDPLAPIKATVEKDQYNACYTSPRGSLLTYSQHLEDLAQVYAVSEKEPPAQASHVTILPFLGAGDPEAQAINRAYQHGAGQEIARCRFGKEYGVGFVRHDDRNVDVVTIVFGDPATPEQAKRRAYCLDPANRTDRSCNNR